MASSSYIKTLKEDNGDITYPQTLASAVFTSGGSDVETEMGKYVTAEDIASTSAISPVVSTSMIQDEAITPAKTSFLTYSTTEQAVGVWIDNKTIYRKTVDVGALPNNATKNVAHGISNLDTVIDCRGFAKATWGAQYPIQTVYASGDAGYNTQLAVDGTNIMLTCTGDNSGKSGYVTIWYTKSS